MNTLNTALSMFILMGSWMPQTRIVSVEGAYSVPGARIRYGGVVSLSTGQKQTLKLVECSTAALWAFEGISVKTELKTITAHISLYDEWGNLEVMASKTVKLQDHNIILIMDRR